MFLRKTCRKKVQSVEEIPELNFLDLPELALEGILSRVPAVALCRLACVSRDLEKRCSSDHFWEPLLLEKWGKIAGAAAYTAWQQSVSSKEAVPSKNLSNHRWMSTLSRFWPMKCCQHKVDNGAANEVTSCDSLMAFFSALESGKFWFPAQVFNRENGHVGFILSCYDAEVSYHRNTNSFHARYPPHGSRTVVIEEDVSWERLRIPPVNTSAYEFYRPVSYDELFPGDHVEVQWKRSSEFPYGWWYGVIGHVDACNRDGPHCVCHLEDMVWLEFKQYTHGSRWRRAAIKRKMICEDGNEADGFYGGIRKLCTKEDISAWMHLWPKESLE